VSAPAATSHARSIAAFILVTLIWGSTWLVIKDQISEVPPAWAVTWRFALAAVGMVPAGSGAARNPDAQPRRDAAGLPMGLFQFFANFQFVYQAEHYLTSGLVAVLFALLMVPNALLARIFVKAEVGGGSLPDRRSRWSGIALLLLHEYRAPPGGGGGGADWHCTDRAALLSASSANVMQATKRRGVPRGRADRLGDGVRHSGRCGLCVDRRWPAGDRYRARAYLAGLAYLAIIGSVVTFPLYFALIRDWGRAGGL
jgi:hypothetical protein